MEIINIKRIVSVTPHSPPHKTAVCQHYLASNDICKRDTYVYPSVFYIKCWFDEWMTHEIDTELMLAFHTS